MTDVFGWVLFIALSNSHGPTAVSFPAVPTQAECEALYRSVHLPPFADQGTGWNRANGNTMWHRCVRIRLAR